MMSAAPVLIILAGGLSSRMWPVREKSLLRFGGEPLLAEQLRRYLALGLTDAVIVANPDSRQAIEALVSELDGLRGRVVVQPEARGMGDALLHAFAALPALDDQPVYVTQVHDVVDDTLHEHILAAHAAEPDASFVAGCEMADYFPGGYLIADGDLRLRGIVEKPGADNRPSNLVNIVAHLHADAGKLKSALGAEYARDLTTDDHYERAMDALMQTHIMRVVPYQGEWKALKFPWHVLDVMDVFLRRLKGQHIAGDAFISDNATISGDVFIGSGAKVFPGAAVVGPAYIGAGTIVGNNALVRHSMVLERCEVGFTTEIARSYVADRVGMHACRVLDSVFLPGVNFSAGCTTANLRIDHGEVKSTVKGQRLGSGRNKFGAIIGERTFLAVDVMTMPGVKIGSDCEIGPGTHVHEDIPDQMRVYVKQDLSMTPRKVR